MAHCNDSDCEGPFFRCDDPGCWTDAMAAKHRNDRSGPMLRCLVPKYTDKMWEYFAKNVPAFQRAQGLSRGEGRKCCFMLNHGVSVSPTWVRKEDSNTWWAYWRIMGARRNEGKRIVEGKRNERLKIGEEMEEKRRAEEEEKRKEEEEKKRVEEEKRRMEEEKRKEEEEEKKRIEEEKKGNEEEKKETEE